MDTRGEELISVAFAGSRAEGEMIQGLLESAGIPSALEQAGIDGPQVGYGALNPAGAPRKVMVHAGRAEEARALLGEAEAQGEPADWAEGGDFPDAQPESGRGPRSYGLTGAYVRIWAWSLAAMALAFGIFLLLRAL